MTRCIGELLTPMYAEFPFDLPINYSLLRTAYNHHWERIDLYTIALTGGFVAEHVYGVE